ncbi:MAG: T9SS type A sorting domain-containing protein [Bacteroidota bacterium]
MKLDYRFLLFLVWSCSIQGISTHLFSQHAELPTARQHVGEREMPAAQIRPQIRSYSIFTQRENPSRTFPISPQNPFFDDFSTTQGLPDSTKWCITDPELRTPLSSFHMAIFPPTWGVLTFDGLDSQGLPYDTQGISEGVADELWTQFIDLSPFSPSDRVVLSFFLQPQGAGNAPETTDLFQVLCTRLDTTADSLETLFTLPGSKLAPFQQYVIELNDPAFFYEEFQLVFRSTGSLNGYLDHWHLDYVNLGVNRSPSDTTFDDQGIQEFSLTILDPYTLYPASIFPPAQNTNSIFAVRVNNLDNQTNSVSTSLFLEEPSGNLLQFGRDLEVLPLQSNSFEILLRDALSPFQETSGTLNVQVQLENAGDNPQNDFLRVPFRVDSLMGYDDGEADGSYGLNRPKGFALQYALPENNRYFLSALWLSFVPRLDASPSSGNSEYLDGKGFQLTIWNTPNPDSILYNQSGFQVTYGDSLNHFERYELAEPVLLPDTFWVGLRQIDGVPIGIGLDRNATPGFLYWDSIGVWTQSKITGLPMVRAEIQQEGNFPTASTPSILSQISIFPNPLPSFQRDLFLETGPLFGKGYLSLYDVEGRKIWERQRDFHGTQAISLDLPASLKAGIYFFQVRFAGNGNQVSRFQQKLLIH